MSQNQNFRFWLAAFTMNNRILTAGVILAITAFFAVGLQKVELRTIFSDLFPKNHPYVQTYKDHPNFGNPLTVTLISRLVVISAVSSGWRTIILDVTRPK